METQTTLFEDITKLATQFVPASADFNPFLQRRRKDLDALLSVGRVTGSGFQSVVSKQVDTLRTLGEDLRAALTEQAEGDRSKSEAVRAAAKKAIGGVAQLAEVVINAQVEIFDTVTQRARANVEELKSLSNRAQ